MLFEINLRRFDGSRGSRGESEVGSNREENQAPTGHLRQPKETHAKTPKREEEGRKTTTKSPRHRTDQGAKFVNLFFASLRLCVSKIQLVAVPMLT